MRLLSVCRRGRAGWPTQRLEGDPSEQIANIGTSETKEGGGVGPCPSGHCGKRGWGSALADRGGDLLPGGPSVSGAIKRLSVHLFKPNSLCTDSNQTRTARHTVGGSFVSIISPRWQGRHQRLTPTYAFLRYCWSVSVLSRSCPFSSLQWFCSPVNRTSLSGRRARFNARFLPPSGREGSRRFRQVRL